MCTAAISKNSFYKSIAAALVVSCMLPQTAFANSAPRIPAEKQYGPMAVGADQLCVEKEILTFDIQALNQQDLDYYNEGLTLADAQDDDGPGTVTAEYYFYNPTSETINARMAFAIGDRQDNKDHKILVDGEEVKSENRYTIYSKDEFYGPKDVQKIYDDYVKDSFFDPELPVTEFTYKVSGSEEKDLYAVFSCEVKDSSKAQILAYGAWYEGAQDSVYIGDGSEIITYVFGDADQAEITWEIAGKKGESNKKIPLNSSKEMSFLDFTRLMASDYPSDISEIDRYNVIVDGLNQYRAKGRVMGYADYATSLWYEYEFTMEPDAHKVNAVTAALAPETYKKSKAQHFTYTYMLSPAKGFAEFGPLDISINTPFYISDNGGREFVKSANGYELHLDTLPEGELEFTLTDSEKFAPEGAEKKQKKEEKKEKKEKKGFLQGLFEFLFD